MPERYVLVRWPDGAAQRIYSPSTIVEEFFSAGQRMPVADFVDQARRALGLASDRVLAAYGHPCGRAARSLAFVEARAAVQPDAADVVVEGIEA
ncbi:MSMEG_0570 family nitrogen starvation response protein [Dactylosporangium sp. CA-052675]|uniref:MSMEG_0570 family nitrogen starvation response protein n=1 Tax=Dactylosporangium sp. CA-052675 TaxID=3239927 RepID=UPI003D8F0C6B